MKEAIDAVVVAGMGEASKNFSGLNKNLLEVAGRPVLARVLDALDGAERVRGIYIAGPVADLEALIGKHGSAWETPVQVVAQQEIALENAMAAFIASLGPGYRPGDEAQDARVADHPVLVMGGDLPLVSAAEIDEFLDGCLTQSIDYGLGLTEEAHLRRFYPTEDQPGIEMPYLHLASGSFRLNNLHFARPFRIGNRPYLQRVYRARYQRELRNMLKIGMDLLRMLGPKPILFYLLLQCCVVLQRWRLRRLVSLIRRLVTEARVTAAAARMLDTRAAIVRTTQAGAAIDIDNEQDYEIIQARYHDFIAARQPAP